jgi:hypothetical protein
MNWGDQVKVIKGSYFAEILIFSEGKCGGIMPDRWWLCSVEVGSGLMRNKISAGCLRFAFLRGLSLFSGVTFKNETRPFSDLNSRGRWRFRDIRFACFRFGTWASIWWVGSVLLPDLGEMSVLLPDEGEVSILLPDEGEWCLLYAWLGIGLSPPDRGMVSVLLPDLANGARV